jgi:hypothetical protein
MTHLKTVTVILFVIIIFSSCAEVEPRAHECVTGHTYGFFGGLWHGIVAPFAFIGSLFDNDIAVWAANNNDGWYTFGFLLGIGALTGGSAKASKSKR